MKLAVFVSGNGSTLHNLIKCSRIGKLDAEIGCVVANTSKARFALQIAEEWDVPSVCIEQMSYHDYDKFNRHLFEIVSHFHSDLVVLAGYTALLKMPKNYHDRTLNIHPSLLPEFGGKGFYGLHVHKEVLKAKKKVTGCSVHLVNDEYDRGQVLAQKKVDVLDDDTPWTLQKRVQMAERELYPLVIQEYLKEVSKLHK